MPRTCAASLVLHTSATLQDVWAAVCQVDFRSPPLSSCGISPEIEVAHHAAAKASAAASTASDTVYDELAQLANPMRSAEAAPSRYIAERTALMQSDRRCFRVAWVERERTHRDILEDAREMRRQARRYNEIRVIPITVPGEVAVAGNRCATRTCNRIFVEWRSSATIFASDLGTVPYQSKLTTAPAERAREMQHGLAQLRRLFDATVLLRAPQVEALLVEQHNAGPDSRFLCSTHSGGAAARALLEGRCVRACV